MATALTRGETSERRPNVAARTGASTTVIAIWARANPPTDARHPVPAEPAAKSAAVATKESQKPADVIDSGSAATRIAAAIASVPAIGAGRRKVRSREKSATIASVRSAGTDAPESSA